jgi:hypothetical protein
MSWVLLGLGSAHVSRSFLRPCAPALDAWVKFLALPGEEEAKELDVEGAPDRTPARERAGRDPLDAVRAGHADHRIGLGRCRVKSPA